MTARLLELPVSNVGDLAGGLRRLADEIETGEYGAAYNVAWIVNSGDGDIHVGMLGVTATAGAEAHLLCALAMRKLEMAAL